MDLVHFKGFLNNNNIFLFDKQSRIALARLNNLKNYDIISKIDKKILPHFIYSLIENNKERINWIINSY